MSDHERFLLLVSAVAAEYADDPSQASVTVSKLKTGEHYISVVRYTQKYGDGKKVVVSSRNKDFGAAVREVSATWLGQKTAKQQLARSIDHPLASDYDPRD